MLAVRTQNQNVQQHRVLDEFDDNYLYNLKALIMLHDKYNFNWLLTKDGEFSFKRHNVAMENEIFYGFCRACKICNIRTKQQMNDLRASQTNRLNDIHVNLNIYLKTAPKVRRFTKRQIKEFETQIKIDYSKENRYKWIMNYGILLNCYCLRSVPDFMKEDARASGNEVRYLNENFEKYMKPDLFGFVDMYYGIILMDNVNLSMIKTNCQTDDYGRVIIKSPHDPTFKTFIQTNIPNTKFNYWHKISDSGKDLRRLYRNETKQTSKKYPKYISILIDPKKTFTATPTIRITNPNRRRKFLTVNKIVYDVL